MRRTSLTMEPQNPLFITFAMSTPRWDQGSSWKTKLVLRLCPNLLHHLPPYGLFEVPIFNVFFLTKVALFWFFWYRWLFSGATMIGCAMRETSWRLSARYFKASKQCNALWWTTMTMIVSDIDQVPNIVVNNQVPWDGWNHLDFLYAIDIDQYQNDDLLAALAMYPIEWVRNI